MRAIKIDFKTALPGKAAPRHDVVHAPERKPIKSEKGKLRYLRTEYSTHQLVRFRTLHGQRRHIRLKDIDIHVGADGQAFSHIQ